MSNPSSLRSTLATLDTAVDKLRSIYNVSPMTDENKQLLAAARIVLNAYSRASEALHRELNK